jgi:hypothetical protein
MRLELAAPPDSRSLLEVYLYQSSNPLHGDPTLFSLSTIGYVGGAVQIT